MNASFSNAVQYVFQEDHPRNIQIGSMVKYRYQASTSRGQGSNIKFSNYTYRSIFFYFLPKWAASFKKGHKRSFDVHVIEKYIILKKIYMKKHQKNQPEGHET